jgi:hypothetical protein
MIDLAWYAAAAGLVALMLAAALRVKRPAQVPVAIRIRDEKR